MRCCLNVLSQLFIAHRDLKAANVLVRAAAPREVAPVSGVKVAADSLAIADFGLCHVVDDPEEG